MTDDSLFRGVDGALFVASLTARLRDAGLPIGPTGANRLARALEVCRPTDVDTLYWTARVTLVGDRRDLATFDRMFQAVFGGIGLPIAPWQRNAPAEAKATIRTEGSVLHRSVPTDGLLALTARVTSAHPDVVDDDTGDAELDPDITELHELLPADLEELADRPFDRLSTDELDRIGRWLADAARQLPVRRTRRRAPSARGAVDLRRTLAGARSTGEVMVLARRRPTTEARPLVMVADVSGSMEAFTRIHLHLLRAFATRPDVGGFEAFVFATSLHRVTSALRQRDAGEVIDRMSAEAADRFGGTRIATSLGRLLSSPRWAHTVRGATVVIASDGWDTDPPELLERRMARLARTARRIVWVNPRSAGPDYRPEVAGMAVALPHVDELCSGHSLLAMGRVIEALTRP